MTVFAKKTMNADETDIVQKQISYLKALGGPRDLMMMLNVETKDPARQEIYIGLPDARLLPAFPGFEEIDRASLPDSLGALVVQEDELKQRFPDIYRKCRARSCRSV